MADSPEYHAAHLAFARSTIVTAAAKGQRILDLLKTYTADVVKAEADSHEGAVVLDDSAIARAVARLAELNRQAVAGFRAEEIPSVVAAVFDAARGSRTMDKIEPCPHCSTICLSCGGPRDLTLSKLCKACIEAGNQASPAVPCCQRLEGAVDVVADLVESYDLNAWTEKEGALTERQKDALAAARTFLEGQCDAPEPSGVGLIAAERRRQVAEEGWTSEHDDTHDRGELGKAAAVYAWPDNYLPQFGDHLVAVANLWPWERSSYKPRLTDRVRELVKAGALIVAEIDRLRRGGQ